MKTFSEFLQEWRRIRGLNTILVPLAVLTGMGTAVHELGKPKPSKSTPEELQKGLERAIADNNPKNPGTGIPLPPPVPILEPKNPGTDIPLPPPVPILKPTIRRRNRNENTRRSKKMV